VFKPALRTDAAERAVRRMLAPILQPEQAAADVRVEPHPLYGTLLTVHLSGPAAARDRVLQQVKARLDPLTLKHTIDWSESATTNERQGT
jgi:hypothetical protein